MGIAKRAVIAASAGLLAVLDPVHAVAGIDDRRSAPREPVVLRMDSSRDITAPAGRASTLRVQRVRLEAAPPPAPQPAVILKFDLVNNGSVTVSDVVLEVAIIERPATDAPAALPRVVAGPFTIRGEVPLHAGYTLNYEMLLRNMPSDCNCVANVAIVADGPVARAGATIPR